MIALVGALRYQEYRSIPEIHQQLHNRGVEVSERSVTHLLERYDELVALWLSDHSALIDSMSQAKNETGTLEHGITHFLKITRSYWSGLFHCYDIEGLARTNNDLQQVFGVLRPVQRHCTGRKVTPSSLVIRGTVHLASAIATALHSFTAQDLA